VFLKEGPRLHSLPRKDALSILSAGGAAQYGGEILLGVGLSTGVPQPRCFRQFEAPQLYYLLRFVVLVREGAVEPVTFPQNRRHFSVSVSSAWYRLTGPPDPAPSEGNLGLGLLRRQRSGIIVTRSTEKQSMVPAHQPHRNATRLHC
jgi:hypothetical protein